MSDFMPGAGVRLWRTIIDDALMFKIVAFHGRWPAPVRRSRLMRYMLKANRYYAALDAINADDRLVCGEPQCAWCQHNHMEQFP